MKKDMKTERENIKPKMIIKKKNTEVIKEYKRVEA